MYSHRSSTGPVDLAFTDRYDGVSAVPFDSLNLALVGDDAGRPTTPVRQLHVVLPRADYTIVDDSWDVVGLKGTGSKDILVADAFVPDYRVFDTDAVVATIRDRPKNVNIVATGRDAPAALVDVADTVTEMRNIKHAYDSGIVAKKGIDY